MQSLRSVNLNLMTILRELLRKGSVTHAAESLNMSQSAVSEALGRIRHLFDDEILIQEGRRFRLSSLAERMRPTVESSLAQMESLLRKAPFEPSDAEGAIKIATTDYLVLLLGDELIRRVAELAPRLTLHFSDFDSDSFKRLLRGQLDFVVSTPYTAESRIESRLLTEHDAVCIVAQNSPIGDRMTQEEFSRARHVAYSPGDEPALSLHASILRSLGQEEFNAVFVQNFLLLPHLVQAAPDMMAIVARPHAEHMSVRTGVRIIDLPFPFPKVRITASWDGARRSDPMIRWFSQLLSTIAGDRELAEATAAALEPAVI